MMAGVDIVLKISTTFHLATWKKLLAVIGEVEISPTPATITPITHVTMVDSCVYLVLLVMLMIVFIKMKEVIVVAMVQDA